MALQDFWINLPSFSAWANLEGFGANNPLLLINWREMTTPNEVIYNPQLFAKHFLKILDKNNKLIPFEWNLLQEDFHNKRTGRDIVLKARQIGFSTYIQGELFRRLVTKSTRALTLTHDDKTTQILRETADRFYKYCRFNNIQPNRRLSNASMSTFTDFDSMHVIGTAGNTDIGRGGSYTDIHLSEVAFFPDPERIIAELCKVVILTLF